MKKDARVDDALGSFQTCNFSLEKGKNYFRFLVFSLGMDEYKSFTIISKNIALQCS